MHKVIKLEDTKIYNVILDVFKDGNERMNEIVKNLDEFVKECSEGFEDRDGLSYCFVWARSKQGHSYWSEIDAVIDSYLVNKEKGMKPMKTMKEIKEQNIISMDKQYTRNGKKVRVLCVDCRCESAPVLIEDEEGNIHRYNKQGLSTFGLGKYDLKEYNPWQDVPVDTKVIVKFFDGEEYPRHFSHYKDGVVHVFTDGNTSFTTTYTTSASSARLA